MSTTSAPPATSGLPSEARRRRPNPLEDRTVRAAVLALTLCIFGALWIAAATDELPYIHHPDEPTNLNVVDAMVRDGDPNPHFFNYPSLFLYLHAAVHLEGPILGGLGGQEVALVPQTLGTTRTATPGSVSVHRAVSVLMGLVTIVAVYATTRLLTGRTGIALAVAVAMATSATLTENATLVTPDVVATALVATTLWISVRLWRSPTWGNHIAAGLLVGLAASTKYNAALAALTVVAAVLTCESRTSPRRRILQLTVSGLTAGAAFVATTPFALLDRSAFLRDVRFERAHYATGHAGMDGDAARWYVDYLLSTETLLVLAALVAIGMALAAGRWRSVILVSAFPIGYGLYAASQAVRNERTILLILPSLAVLGGLGLAILVERLHARRRPRTSRTGAMIIALTAIAAVTVGQASRAIDALDLSPSTWETSRHWVEDNIPAGSSILIEAYSPWVDPDRYDLRTARSMADDPGALSSGVSHLIVSESMYSRYLDDPARFPDEVQVYETLFARSEQVAVFEGDGPTIQILVPR